MAEHHLPWWRYYRRWAYEALFAPWAHAEFVAGIAGFIALLYSRWKPPSWWPQTHDPGWVDDVILYVGLATVLTVAAHRLFSAPLFMYRELESRIRELDGQESSAELFADAIRNKVVTIPYMNVDGFDQPVPYSLALVFQDLGRRLLDEPSSLTTSQLVVAVMSASAVAGDIPPNKVDETHRTLKGEFFDELELLGLIGKTADPPRYHLTPLGKQVLLVLEQRHPNHPRL